MTAAGAGARRHKLRGMLLMRVLELAPPIRNAQFGIISHINCGNMLKFRLVNGQVFGGALNAMRWLP